MEGACFYQLLTRDDFPPLKLNPNDDFVSLLRYAVTLFLSITRSSFRLLKLGFSLHSSIPIFALHGGVRIQVRVIRVFRHFCSNRGNFLVKMWYRRSIPSRVLMPMWLRLLDILQKYHLLHMWREAFVFLQLKCSVLDKMAFYSLGSCILPLDTLMLFNLVLLFHKDPGKWLAQFARTYYTYIEKIYLQVLKVLTSEGGFLETCNCSTEVFELVRSCFEPSRVGFSLHYPWTANVIF